VSVDELGPLGLPDRTAVEGTDVEKLVAFQETLRGMRQRIALFVPAALRDVVRADA
jgi:hypothetical protein